MGFFKFRSNIHQAHSHVMRLWNDASRSMTNGHYKQAVERWTRAMEFQEESARAAGIPLGFRFLQGASWTAGFGHIALLDFFAKARLLKLISTHHVVLAWPGTVANQTYLDRWRPWIHIETDRKKIEQYDTRLLEDYPAVLKVSGKWHWLHDAMNIVEGQWKTAGRSSLLQLSADEIEHGWRTLSSWGVPRDGWFVTLHVRERGVVSGSGDKADSLRNAEISAYLPAIERVTDAGGWVVRIGDDPVVPLPAMPRVVERKGHERDFIDVFLLSQAHFVIVTNSGPAWVAGTFGVPALLTNWAPIGIKSHYHNTVTLPKRLWSISDRRPLTGAEHDAEPYAFLESASALAEHGLVQVPNTPEEIANAVSQMIAAPRIPAAVPTIAGSPDLTGQTIP